jgi:hypothetical protein
VRVLRRVFVLAIVAVVANLTPISAHANALTPKQQAKVQWYLASSLTLQRQWYGTIAANHPHQVCVKNHESIHAGLYSAYDGSGNYGAYQDDQSTWDSAAVQAGRPDLVGVRPDLADWWDQEQVNWTLYLQRGDQPWGMRCPQPVA